MTPKSPTIKPVSDTGANNEFALRYTANGHATKDVGLSQAADSVMVRARNSHNATNAVCIRVRLGGTPIAPDQCLGRGASTCRDVMFSSVGVPAGAAVRIAVSALEVQGKDALHVGKVRLDGPASPQSPAPTGQACNLNQRIANATDGQVIDGGGCVERSYVELRKKLTLKNITVSGTDNWTGGFSPSGGDYRSTLTVPELVEPQQTSDPMNTTLCESQDAAMLCSEAEMVFLDGRYLSQRPDGADPGPGEFALDAGRRVMLGDDPTGKKVEVATRQRGLHMASGSGGTVLENVDVTQVANTIGKSGTGAVPGNNGNALTVRNSEVSWTHGSAVQCGGGVRCEITASEFHHAGEAGMTSYGVSPLLFQNNTVRDNCSQTGLPDVSYNDSFICSGLKITGESPEAGSSPTTRSTTTTTPASGRT